jgi:hypothetical protein
MIIILQSRSVFFVLAGIIAAFATDSGSGVITTTTLYRIRWQRFIGRELQQVEFEGLACNTSLETQAYGYLDDQ